MSSSLLNRPDAGTPALYEAGDGMVTLRLSGGKPMHMRAELLARCSSWSAGAQAWHELALYHRDSADFAIGLKTCLGPMGGSDVFHARLFPDLDAALGWVQGFDLTADLDADIASSDQRISTTDIALRAATLRQQADRLQQQYRSMVAELLYRLGAGE